jgi:pSer/pThr/pTyr-binding forkhead associated (FHA) protein
MDFTTGWCYRPKCGYFHSSSVKADSAEVAEASLGDKTTGRRHDDWKRTDEATALNETTMTAMDADEPFCTLRLVVTASKVLNRGSLVLLSDNGCTIGRDRAYGRRLRLPEMMVSKLHAQVYTETLSSGCTDDTPPMPMQYHIVDLGSQHGTFVNGQRLSPPKVASHPCPLVHGDVLSIGTTTFAVHSHTFWGCDECKTVDAVLVSLDNEAPSKAALQSTVYSTLDTTREEQRRMELKRLKGLMLKPVETDSPIAGAHLTTEYVDRAALRRKAFGDADEAIPNRDNRTAINEEQQQPAEPVQKLNSSNKGYQMLLKAGWHEGQGIGKTPGRVDPVVIKPKLTRAGISSHEDEMVDIFQADSSTSKQDLHMARNKVYSRFDEL